MLSRLQVEGVAWFKRIVNAFVQDVAASDIPIHSLERADLALRLRTSIPGDEAQTCKVNPSCSEN